MIEDRGMESMEKGVGEDGRRVHPVLPSLALAFKRTISVMERESGVAGMKLFVLGALARRNGMSQGEFAQEYEMADASRVTRTAQALEAEGHISRERDPEDNRVVRMYLTGEGREVLKKVPVVNEELRRRVLSVLSEEEFEELRRMLGLLAGAMKNQVENQR